MHTASRKTNPSTPSSTTAPETLGDLLDLLGGVHPSRVRATPFPGTATEADLLRMQKKDGGLFELVNGTLVEKAMGQVESFLALELARHLGNFLEVNPLGYLTGADGEMRIIPNVVRLPDIAFVSFEQLHSREMNTETIAPFSPALAVEVISRGNTVAEIALKRRQYFAGGTRLMWVVYPKRRTVVVWTSPDVSATLTEQDVLSGGDVLSGFELPLQRLFAKLPSAPTRKGTKDGKGNESKRRGRK
jgi:Uma2 family endonuclease